MAFRKPKQVDSRHKHLTEKQKQKRIKEYGDKQKQRVMTAVNDVSQPVKYSLIVAVMWIVIGIALGFIFHLANDDNYASDFMTSFAIIAGISALWTILRFGMFEKTRMRARNYRNKRFAEKLTGSSVDGMTMDIDQFREHSKKYSYVGIIVLAAVSITVVIITSLVYYL